LALCVLSTLGQPALLFIAPRLLPQDRRSGERRRLDLVGTGLLGVAIVTVMLPVIESGERGVRPSGGCRRRSGDVVLFVAWEWWLEKRGGHHWSNSSCSPAQFLHECAHCFLFLRGFPVVFTIANLYYSKACTTRRSKPPWRL